MIRPVNGQVIPIHPKQTPKPNINLMGAMGFKELVLEGARWRLDYDEKWRHEIKTRRFQPVGFTGVGTLKEIPGKYESIAWVGDSPASALAALECLATTRTAYLLLKDKAGKGSYAILHNLGHFKKFVRSWENQHWVLQNDAGYDVVHDPIPVREFPRWLRPRCDEILMVSETVLRKKMLGAPQYERLFPHLHQHLYPLVWSQKFPQPLVCYVDNTTPAWVHQVLAGEVLWGFLQMWNWLKTKPELEQFRVAFRTVWYPIVAEFVVGNNPLNDY